MQVTDVLTDVEKKEDISWSEGRLIGCCYLKISLLRGASDINWCICGPLHFQFYTVSHCVNYFACIPGNNTPSMAFSNTTRIV